MEKEYNNFILNNPISEENISIYFNDKIKNGVMKIIKKLLMIIIHLIQQKRIKRK